MTTSPPTEHVPGTVVFTLAGPQQAWSARERGAVRPTQDHPTKSGVIGLVANALGRDRGDDISDLTALAFAVRADRPGYRDSDFHTSGSGPFPLLATEILNDPATARVAAKGGVPQRIYAAPKNISRNSDGVLIAKRAAAIVTRDEYLVDAVFTVALSGPPPLIAAIAGALSAPARSLFLGRRAYPLSRPPRPTLVDIDDPRQVLAGHPLADGAAPAPATVWADAPPHRAGDRDARLVADVPTSFARRRALPRVETRTLTTPSTGQGEPGPGELGIDFFAPEDQP